MCLVVFPINLYQAVLTLPDAYHMSVAEEDMDK